MSGVPHTSPFYDPVQDTCLGPDLDKARELLDSIGIRDGDGGGILEYENGDDVHILVGAYNPIRRGGTVREQPAEYDRAHELENQMATATTLDEWRAAVQEYFNYTSTDALQFIHFVTDRPAMVIRHNRMGNIPDNGFYWKALILSKSDQYFIREGMQ